MLIKKITYNNKEYIRNDPNYSREQTITDEDMNEIKEVVNTNAEEQNIIVEKLKNALLNAETEESKSIHVEDANKFGQLEVLGNHEQEMREGYNLLQNKLTDTTINGVTFKINEDKSVTVNGTATANIIANLITGEYNDNNASEPLTISDTTTNCRLSGCPIGGSNSTYKLDLWTSNGVLKGTDYGEGINISMSSDSDRKLSRARLIIYSGATVNNLTFKPMLVAGTEEREYEQYGASPSPNYPSEVVCLGSNKNILDTSLIQETTKGGITSKINSDGSITFNGTCTTNNNVFDFYIENATKFTFDATKDQTTISAFHVSGSITDSNDSRAYFRVNNKNYNGGYINLVNLPQQKQLTHIYNSTSGSVFCDIRFNNGVVLDNFTIKCKAANTLEDAFTYSPYGQGSTLISKINKNFYDKTNAIQRGLWGNNNSNLINTNYVGWYVIVKIIGGKTYTISRKNGEEENSYLQLAGTSTADFPANGVEMLNRWTQDLQNNGKKLQIQTAENANYLLIGLAAGQISEITEEVQTLAMEELMVNIEDTATNYVEHQQTDYLLYIQQEMLQGDYFIKEADGWKEVHGFGKYVFDGTENYVKSPLSDDDYLKAYTNTATISAEEIKFDGKMFATRYKNIGIYSSSTTDNRIACRSQLHTQISTEFLTENTAEAYKALLAKWKNEGNPLVVFYELINPTKLACTETQSAVLEELNNMDLFEGVNNIITAEDIALLKLKYSLDVKSYVDNKISSLTTQTTETTQEETI